MEKDLWKIIESVKKLDSVAALTEKRVNRIYYNKGSCRLWKRYTVSCEECERIRSNKKCHKE